MPACLPEAECQVALAEADGRVSGIELVRANKAAVVVHLAAVDGLLSACIMLSASSTVQRCHGQVITNPIDQ